MVDVAITLFYGTFEAKTHTTLMNIPSKRKPWEMDVFYSLKHSSSTLGAEALQSSSLSWEEERDLCQPPRSSLFAAHPPNG